jgi:hypothetical protein
MPTNVVSSGMATSAEPNPAVAWIKIAPATIAMTSASMGTDKTLILTGCKKTGKIIRDTVYQYP